MAKSIKFEMSSGNEFADGGMPNAEEHLLKAKLVSRLDDILKARKLTQSAAGRLLGIAQPDLSKILVGQFREVSVARLLRFMSDLEQDVEIVLTPKRKGAKRGRLSVRAA